MAIISSEFCRHAGGRMWCRSECMKGEGWTEKCQNLFSFQLLTNHYEQNWKYYCLPSGLGNMASEEELHLTKKLFWGLFDALSQKVLHTFMTTLPVIYRRCCILWTILHHSWSKWNIRVLCSKFLHLIQMRFGPRSTAFMVTEKNLIFFTLIWFGLELEPGLRSSRAIMNHFRALTILFRSVWDLNVLARTQCGSRACMFYPACSGQYGESGDLTSFICPAEIRCRAF